MASTQWLFEAIRREHYAAGHKSVPAGRDITTCTDGLCPAVWGILRPRQEVDTRKLQAVAFLVDGEVFGFEVEVLDMEAQYGNAQIEGLDWPFGITYSTGDATIKIHARRWRRLGEDRWVGFRSLQEAMDKAASRVGEKIPGEWRLRLKFLDEAESTYRVTIAPGGGEGLSAAGIIEALHHELDILASKAIRRWRQDHLETEDDEG